MDKFARYLAAVDGTRGWDEIAPLFDDAFHPDCVFVTDDGEYDKTQWTEMVKGLVDKGAVASGFEVTRTEGDAVFYDVTVTVDGAGLPMSAKGTLSGDRLIRVEPVDPSQYSEMVRRSS